MVRRRNSVSVYKAALAGLLAWVLAMAFALKFGAVSDVSWEIVSQLRLPRALLATAIGMGLAVSGAALQALFANPLCEPYTLGISSGSALGTVMGATVGFQLSVAGLTGSSFLGALAFAFFLYLISLRPGRGNLTLLLSGVVLGLLGSSLVAVWMALADADGIQGALFWLLGDLSRARSEGALFSLGAALVLCFIIWIRRHELDALLMGEDDALALGISVAAARRRLLLLTSLLVGLCVSGGGMIGFVGLVVPHFSRRFVGSLHGALIPVAAIWGAATLTFADALARWLASPHELPVGVVTALAGAPLFLWMMLQREEERGA